MAEQLTRPGFYLSGFFMFVVVMFMFMNYMVEVETRDILLDNESIDYITDYQAYLLEYGIVSIQAEDMDDLKGDAIVGDDNETAGQSIADVLATLNFYRNKVTKTVNYIKLFYHLPTLCLLSLSLPIEPFAPLINGITIILYISMIYLFIRLIRGS